MCLIIRSNELKAEKDIVCYKVVGYQKILDTYYSPFTSKRIHRECITEGMHFIAEGNKQVHFGLYGGTISISEGQIHTLKKELNACHLAFLLKGSLHSGMVLKVFKCIIPEGTMYYEGRDESTDSQAYASDKIVFKEEINWENVCA